ncbi:MAG: ABC transporter ATP-binding protein [Deltaproteobacteria bacterium]|nr:ABC transporter ATP-binding protein [Deltaproteobacteria bacterium]
MFRAAKQTIAYLKEVFQKPESRQGDFRYKDVLFFLQFVKPSWKLGLVSLVLTVVSTALGSLLPLSSKFFMDYVIMNQGLDNVETFLNSHHLGAFVAPVTRLLGSVNLMVAVILVIGMIIGVIGIIEKIMTLRFQQEITFHTQTALFDHVLRFPLSFLKEKQVGYLMSRVSGDVNLLQYFFSIAIPQLATNIFYCIFGFIILFSLNNRLSLALLVILPVLIFINYFFAARARSVSYKEMERQAQVSKDMQEVFSGAELIKAYVSEKREVDKISDKIRTLFSTRLKSTILTAMSGSLTRATKLVCTLFIVLFGVNEIHKGAMTIGDFTAFIVYVVYLSGRMTGISSTFMTIQTVFASMRRLLEMFNTIPEFRTDKRSESLIIPQKAIGEIRFENIWFCYEKNKPVLNNIAFTVQPGEVIALTGASGAGKTTIINLLLKFYSPQSGLIYLDNYELGRIDTQWLRRQIGVVSQEIFLFNDTVENNIKYGRPSAGMEDVILAARNADINDYIENLEGGYNTIVGERGANLSTGQRQRISIARAFLKDPPILIFDEPSSALDADTENELKNSLGKLTRNRTTFIISHRMSMTHIADRVFELEGGRIIEKSNSHDLRLRTQSHQRRT